MNIRNKNIFNKIILTDLIKRTPEKTKANENTTGLPFSPNHSRYVERNETERIETHFGHLIEEPELVQAEHIKCISINIHGINSKTNDNANYINKLLRENNYGIITIQEHWCETIEEFEDSITHHYPYKLYFKPATKLNTTGHPKGGLAFYVSNEYLSSCYFQSERMGTIKVGGTAIIGVYHSFEDTSKELRKIARQKFSLEIQDLKSHIQNLERLKYNVTVMGDFNTDFKRKNSYFTKTLTSMMSEINYYAIDILHQQSVDYTYKSGNKQSYIDHILTNINSSKTTGTYIVDDEDNESDHRAIECSIEQTSNKNERDKIYADISFENQTKINWVDPLVRNKYNEILDYKLNTLINDAESLNDEMDHETVRYKLMI